MTRKRKIGEKGKAGAQKKGAQKRDGSTSSSRTRSKSQMKGKHTSHPSPARASGHGRQSTDAAEPEPLSKDVQTQTSSGTLENKETQTETLSQATQQTQTELNGNTETTEVSQPTEPSPEDVEMEVETGLPRNKGNESDGEKDESVERKKRKVSETREPTEETKEKTKLSDASREQDGDKQKYADTKEKHLEGDSQKDTNLKSGTEEPKSYAAAAAAGKAKESKEKGNQTEVNQGGTMESKKAQRKPSTVRYPAESQMLTFYIYAVLDKRFRFNKLYDSLLFVFLQWNEVKLEIKHFRGLYQDGYLIEATFSVPESDVRGCTIQYMYAVHQRQKQTMEIAVRYVEIPADNTVKEFHLYEGYISCSNPGSVQDWFKGLFQSEKKDICKGWETSARVLLDRVFQKWQPSNPEKNKTFIQQLNDYKKGFQSHWLQFPEGLAPFPIKVSDLISAKLNMILKGDSEVKKSDSSTGIKSLKVALSVFQVCCGCDVDLGTKDWGKLCQVISERIASLEEMQTAQPLNDFTVVGLMNLCARKLISELVLLVPVLHLLRKPEAKSDPGSAMNEQRWAGLENIEYTTFRDGIRGLRDKRSMVLQLIKDHLSMTKDNPYLLKSWLSMVAFEDVPEFVQLTGIVPELLIQSLMYRMKETEKNTDPNSTEKNLEATEKVLNLLLKRVEEDRERITENKLSALILCCCRNVHKGVCTIARLVPQYRVAVLSFKLLLKTTEILHDLFSKGGEETKQKQNWLLSMLNEIQMDFSKWRDGLLHNPLMKESKLTYPKEIQLWNGLYGIECSIPGISDSWKSLLDQDLRWRLSHISVTDQVVVCCLVMSEKTIKNSHANLQSCFKDMCQAAVKNKCKANKEGELLHHLFIKSLSWPVVSSIIVESAARFGEDYELRLLDPQSAINFLLSQDKWNQWKLEDDANHLIADSQSFLGSLIQTLCQGSIALGHLKTILKSKSQFQKLYNQYKKNNKKEKISMDVSELLSQREDDLKAFDQQKEYMTKLINMLGKITDVVDGKEVTLGRGF